VRAEAERVGFPVMLKAAAGGGGKGMRLVTSADALESALARAQGEALSAFGDARVYIEKALERPRHVEIQVLADAHGNVVHLFERECSIQRRHQKVVEESPSPSLTPERRARMGALAVALARRAGYVNAGTLEFLVDAAGEPYFLEMNTRLQVEHPVTEMVTGIDLVDLQLRVAAGEPLGFEQQDVALRGHAIECRITSEDPYGGFLPSRGTISHLEIPGGPGVRWDGGIQRGHEVTLHYDPLLAKLIAYGPDRPRAIARMARALDELVIVGVDTSTPYLRSVMDEPDFAGGDLSIAYVDEHAHLLDGAPSDRELSALALAGALLEEEYRERHRTPRIAAGEEGMSRWRASGWPWRGNEAGLP
jgi:acetyl-CoA carboxylase biotin carboxylase subunit